MQNFLNNFKWGIVLFFVSAICGLAFAGGSDVARGEISSMFAQELNRNGGYEITHDEDNCVSKSRPLHVNQELTEILSTAIQYSRRMNVKTVCQKVEAEKEFQYCQFYFYSTKKSEQWSIGFTFLGNPADGKIKLDSLRCFSTP